MRWNIRGITSRNTSRTIDQKVWKGCWQDSWFFLGIVKVPCKRDCLFLDILKKIACNLRQTRLGITHSRRRISVHRTVITMHFNQNLTVFPVLRHTNHGIIDRRITVWVEIPHDVPDRLGRLAVALVKGIAILIHRIKNTTLNRLQAITNIWQSPVLNNVLGVATKALSHDVLKGHILNVRHRILSP